MSDNQILTVEELIKQIKKAMQATQSVIVNCTDEQWGAGVQDEEGARTVGVICHHIVYAIPFVVEWAVQLAQGEGSPTITYDDVHALNHQHAEAQAAVDQATTLALLQTNLAMAQEKLGVLSDADLQKAAPFQLIGGQLISVQQMVQWFMINHAHNHIETIMKTTGDLTS